MKLYELDVIGYNGTITNTGWKTGVYAQLMKKLKRPTTVCVGEDISLLNFNELSFQHLFQTLDDKTPISFSGPIRTHLGKCYKLKLLFFDIVEFVIPEINRRILSKNTYWILVML